MHEKKKKRSPEKKTTQPCWAMIGFIRGGGDIRGGYLHTSASEGTERQHSIDLRQNSQKRASLEERRNIEGGGEAKLAGPHTSCGSESTGQGGMTSIVGRHGPLEGGEENREKRR